MQEIGAFEAKNTFGTLLDRVEHGEEIVITRRGKAVARLVPEKGRDQAAIEQAMAGIIALRKKLGKKVTLDDLLSARHEGHKY